MSRAERRRQNADKRRLMRFFCKQSAGLFNLVLLRRGGPISHAMLMAVGDWLVALRDGRNDPLCLCCDADFREHEPIAFIVCIPHCDTPDIVTVSGLCRACAERPDKAVLDAAVTAWRRIVPDARPLSPAHLVTTAGRA